jgi:hypothetical protein
MLNGTLAREVGLLRTAGVGLEKRLLTQPVGPARNAMVAAIARVDQKLASLRPEEVERDIVDYLQSLPDINGRS